MRTRTFAASSVKDAKAFSPLSLQLSATSLVTITIQSTFSIMDIYSAETGNEDIILLNEVISPLIFAKTARNANNPPANESKAAIGLLYSLKRILQIKTQNEIPTTFSILEIEQILYS